MLKLFATAGPIMLAVLMSWPAAAAAERPNLLWITCEDMGPRLGCYGDDGALTPAIDALAARGLRYTNANSTAPVCAPARTAIISGLYPASTGAEHMRSEVRLPAGFRMFPQLLREVGYYCTNNSKEDYNLAKPGRVWDESNRKAHWRHRAKGQPFFAVFNSTTTHESQIRNEIDEKHRVHDPAQVRVPAYQPDTPEVRRDWAQHYERIAMMDAETAVLLREIEDAGLSDDTIIFFFSDHGSGMPRNKRWLYQSGLRVPLIVYFPPKWQHLAPQDYHEGGTSDRLVSFVDLAPTVLSLAGLEPPEWTQGGAFAGKHQDPEPAYSYGSRARMDERYDLVRSVRDKRYSYIRNYMPHRPYGQHLSYEWETPTTRVWKRLFEKGKLNKAEAAFWEQKPAEELYDLESDPEEVQNLADSPAHRDVLKRLRGAHRQWAREIKDVGLLSEWEMHERSGSASPYEMGHDPQQYDLDSILAAAELASLRREEDLPELRALLDSRDSGVRYWAAVGLLAQEAAGVAAARDKLRSALVDNSPMVRITAAEALGRFGKESDAFAARDVLLKYTEPNGNFFLAIAAWNALDFLDGRSLPALDRIRSIDTDWSAVSPRMGAYAERLKQTTLRELRDRHASDPEIRGE